MLQPKRTRFRKKQTGHNRGFAQRGNKVSFGEYALKATARGRMTARQIEAARRAISRHVKRGGKLWIRVFPDVPITKKARATSSTGSHRYSPAASSTRLTVSRRKSPGRHSGWRLPSCRSRQAL
jgi:ribosomal protein L16